MALTPLATQGNYFHVFDFHVKPGTGAEFIDLFNNFDYSDANPFHKSSAQVRDGVLCRDTKNPDHFYLIGEWADIEAHMQIGKLVAGMKPEFLKLIQPGQFVPTYAEIVSSTPQHLLDKSQQR